MSRYEKRMKALRDEQDAVGRPGPRHDPMTGVEIESFLRGFDLSAAAVRQILEKWEADATLQYRAGYHDASEEAGD